MNEKGKSKTGMGSHQSHKMIKDEWLTPPEIISMLGDIDLDPCSPINKPWPTAKAHFTKEDDGLSKIWHGFVFCNPPYGRETGKWLQRLSKHGNGIALIFARTETKMFFSEVWSKADAILFIEGRLHFHHVTGEKAKLNSGAPSCLVAYGHEAVKRLERIKSIGKLLKINYDKEQ